MYNWDQMSVGILGAGIENISLCHYLLEKGAKIIIYDQNDPFLISNKLKELEGSNLMIVAGVEYEERISQHDIFFRSPGMSLEYAKKITKAGGQLSSAMQLFFELCPAKIIGVTGSKGKGTTASLIGSVLDEARKNNEIKGNSYVMGNIGRAPFDIINDLKAEDWVVMELSSFQLEDMTISPHVAVVLNITPDHLAPSSSQNPNYHKSFRDYIEAKKRIVENQTEDDLAVFNFPSKLDESKELFNEFCRVTKAEVWSVDSDCSRGVFVKDGWMFVKDDDKKIKIFNGAQLQLLGDHNFSNAQVAGLVGYLLKIKPDTIAKGLTGFKGLPHRLEFARELNGVKYYDDSYATDPDASSAAVMSFSDPVVLIAGGKPKGSSFSILATAISNSHVKAVILIGEAAGEIQAALQEEKVDIPIISGGEKMKEILEKARSLTKSGDVVLLSPACASFDMFKNASDRGDQFQREVRLLD